jgi:hypothetical protein
MIRTQQSIRSISLATTGRPNNAVSIVFSHDYRDQKILQIQNQQSDMTENNESPTSEMGTSPFFIKGLSHTRIPRKHTDFLHKFIMNRRDGSLK